MTVLSGNLRKGLEMHILEGNLDVNFKMSVLVWKSLQEFKMFEIHVIFKKQ